MNISAPSTIGRDYWDAPTAGFSGTLNISGGRYIEFRSNGGSFDNNLGNAILNIDNESIGFRNYSGGATIKIGALSGTATASLTGAAYGGRGTFEVGARNLDTTYAGSIQDSAALTKVGTGALTLSGSNLYTGPTIVSAGKLILAGATLGKPPTVDSNGVVTATNGTAVTVATNAAFGGYGTVNGSVTYSTNSTLLVNPAGTLAVAGNLTFSNGTIKVATAPAVSQPTGTCTLYTCTGTLSGTPNFVWSDAYYSATLTTNAPGQITATFTRNAADLVWAGVNGTNWNYPATNWTWVNGQINFQDADRVKFDDSSAVNTIYISNTVSPGSVTVDSSRNYTFSGTGGIGGTNGLTKSGTGTLTLSTSNSYTGKTYVYGGTLKLATNAFIGPGTATIAGGKLILEGGTLGSTNVIVSTNGALGGYGTIKGNVTFSNNSTLFVNPAGPMAVTGNLTFSNGTIMVSPVPGANLVLGTPYTFYTYTGTLTGTPNFLWADTNFGATFATNTPGQITVTVTRPPADLTWTGAGGTNWNQTATNWTWVGGLVNFQNLDRVKFDDTSAVNGVNIPGTVTPGSVTVNSSKNYAFSGAAGIGGTGKLTKSGSGTLTLSTTNTYSGGTYIDGGTLNLTTSAGIGSGAVNIGNETSLRVAQTLTNNVVLAGTNNFIQGSTAANIYLGGKWSGSGVARFSWTDGQTLSVNTSANFSNYSGTILLGSSGTSKFYLRLNPGSSTIASLDYSTAAFDLGVGSDVLSTRSGVTSLRLGALSGGVNTKLSPSGTTTLWIGARNENTTFSGTITGDSSIKLTKEGTGTLTLAGTNHSYTGSTVVSAGGLLFSGYTKNTTAVTVAAGATIGGTGRLAGTLTLSNGARLALGFGAKATNGLTVAKTSTLNGNITVVPALLGGQLGTGTYTLLAYSGALGGSPVFTWNDTTGSGYTATFNTNTAGVVKITLSAPLAAPGTLIATPGNQRVSLMWTAAPGATSYNVLRSATSGSGYTVIASGLTSPSYIDGNVTNNTTYYYVVAAAANGTTSAYSPQASATPIPPPAAPATITVTPGDAQVDLSWSAVDSASSYTVLRSTTSNSGFTSIASGLSETTYTDAGIANNTTYYYVVTASGDGGTSALSSVTSATPAGAPAAPTSLNATPGNARVTLEWSTVPNATSYNVLRSTTPGTNFSAIASGLAATSYTDQSVTNNTAYYYVVTATGTGGTSEYSPEAFAAPVAPPAAPTGLTATAGEGQVSLAWTGVELASSYAVLRSTASGSGYVIIAPDLALPAYTDASVTPGVTYYYMVTASNAGGTGPTSSEVSAMPAAPPPTLPSAPASLTALGGSGVVNLAWSAVAGAETYTVKRSLVDGSYQPMATGVTSMTYADTAVENGTTYYYVVNAVNTAGTSADSASDSATPSVTLLEAWRNVHFGTTSSTANAANDADPDGDGLSNLVEYAVGSDPRTASASAVRMDIANNHMQLSFSQVADPALSYDVNATTDLVNWSNIWSSSGDSNVAGQIIAVDPIEVSSVFGRFIHLEISTTEP